MLFLQIKPVLIMTPVSLCVFVCQIVLSSIFELRQSGSFLMTPMRQKVSVGMTFMRQYAF